MKVKKQDPALSEDLERSRDDKLLGSLVRLFQSGAKGAS